MSKILFENVSFSYEEEQKKAIDNISFDLKKGEFIGILGHNGSGKSTIAKLINSLLIQQEGTILVNGLRNDLYENLFEIRKDVGLVFQNPDNQIVGTIVEDDVAFGPENLELQPSEIRKRVDNSLKQLEMIEFANRAPYELSGGQKQRVAIAGVLAMEPSCIIFDEPTAMLDPIGRKEVLSSIKYLHEKGISIILITHFMEEIKNADKIIALKDSKVEIIKTPDEFFKDFDKLINLSLSLPEEFMMIKALRDRNINLMADIMDIEGLVKEICQYVQKT